MSHAELSPSAAHRWLRCQGSVVLSKDIPNTSSEYAAEGSVAHDIGYRCLFEGRDAVTFIGQTFTHDGYTFTVTDEMAQHVQTYVDYVRRQTGTPLYEQKLPIMHITGEQDAHGTADAVVIDGDTLHILDLKYGMGVKVSAELNEQLQLYALAALHQYSVIAEFRTVVLHIVQPRLDHIDTWETTVDDLLEFQAEVALASLWVEEAKQQLDDRHFVVGEKQCKFCPAKGDCRALANYVMNTVRDDFTDLSQPITDLNTDRGVDNQTLGNLMSAVPLIEDWCKAIRARVESELFAGNAVDGFKLVEGRRGARKWTDEFTAEHLLTAELGDDAFDVKLISPTFAEKLLKKSPCWEDIQALTTRSEGRPSVAPTSDKRPALSLASQPSDFENLQ